MASTPKKLIEYLQTIDTTYKDCRVLTNQELRALVWFFLYGQNVFSQVGRDWVGCVFRQRELECLLVVKSRREGTQQVAFVTARTPIDCVWVFCKKWYADTVAWSEDKFA
jgi:hypothetical protein